MQERVDASPEPNRRQRIIDAAFQLFAERGFAGTSTLAIASRARVSKRELYTLFGDKAAILTICVAERAAEMSEPLRPPAPSSRAALEAALAAFGAGLLRELCRPGTVAAYRLAIAEAERAPEVARTLDAIGQKSVRRAALDLLAASISAGLLAGDANALMDLFLATLQVHRTVLRLLLREIEPPDEATIADRANAAARAVLSAGAPP